MEAYYSLFLLSFLAATLLPAASEVFLSGLLISGYDPLQLWGVATLGNTLGGVVNYLLGRYLLHFQDRSWFPVKTTSLTESQRWFRHYGIWSLLFAWLPIVGDFLTFVAGVMRVSFPVFVLLVAIGKGVRYGLILGVVNFVPFL